MTLSNKFFHFQTFCKIFHYCLVTRDSNPDTLLCEQFLQMFWNVLHALQVISATAGFFSLRCMHSRKTVWAVFLYGTYFMPYTSLYKRKVIMICSVRRQRNRWFSKVYLMRPLIGSAWRKLTFLLLWQQKLFKQAFGAPWSHVRYTKKNIRFPWNTYGAKTFYFSFYILR